MIKYWYWNVVEFQDQVFGSQSMSYIPLDDPQYQDWLVRFNQATAINTGQELGAVLIQNWTPMYLGNGLAITSMLNPGLNGTYAVQDPDLNRISSISTGIAAGKGLPGGGETFYYADMSDNLHAFNATEFLNFAKSIENFIYNLRVTLRILAQHGVAQMPEQPVNIDPPVAQSE